MSDAPERIFLQDAGDYARAAAFEVTWCVEPQDDADTEYIRADKVQSLVEALDDVADKCTSDEIPEGYGPDMTENPEFHRGYDAALHRVRRALAIFRGDAKP